MYYSYTQLIICISWAKIVKLGNILDDIRDKIIGILSGSQYDVMKLALISGGLVVLLDLFADFFVFYPGSGIVYVLNLNLALISLWHSMLIVISFLAFGYSFIVYRDEVMEKKDSVDAYISSTIEAIDALRYNLYSMRMAIHSSNSTDVSKEEIVDSVEKGLSISIDLIDAYLENQC